MKEEKLKEEKLKLEEKWIDFDDWVEVILKESLLEAEERRTSPEEDAMELAILAVMEVDEQPPRTPREIAEARETFYAASFWANPSENCIEEKTMKW